MTEQQLVEIEIATKRGDCITPGAVLAMVAEIRSFELKNGKPIHIPNEDPITGLPFMMMIERPDGLMVPTYGGPYDSYTIPEREEIDGNIIRFSRDHYDHDMGGWTDPEIIREVVTDEDNVKDSWIAGTPKHEYGQFLLKVKPEGSKCERIVKAFYAEKLQIDVGYPDDPEIYDQNEHEEYYLKEGFYEDAQWYNDESSYADIPERDIVAWMPLSEV